MGIDSVNIDDMSGGSRPAHSLLLAAGIPVVEHLTNLDQVPPTGARFFAAPPLVRGFGTFPVRAYVSGVFESATCSAARAASSTFPISSPISSCRSSSASRSASTRCRFAPSSTRTLSLCSCSSASTAARPWASASTRPTMFVSDSAAPWTAWNETRLSVMPQTPTICAATVVA